jgi:hypothetical protein
VRAFRPVQLSLHGAGSIPAPLLCRLVSIVSVYRRLAPPGQGEALRLASRTTRAAGDIGYCHGPRARNGLSARRPATRVVSFARSRSARTSRLALPRRGEWLSSAKRTEPEDCSDLRACDHPGRPKPQIESRYLLTSSKDETRPFAKNICIGICLAGDSLRPAV